MASSAEIMQPLPETLPDDFSEWDSGHSAASQSQNFRVSAAAAEDRPAKRPPSLSANPQYTAVAVSDESNVLPRFTAGSFDAEDEFLLRSFRLKEAREIRPISATKTRTILTIAAVPSLLLLLAIVPGLRSRLAGVKHPIANPTTAADRDIAANAPDSSPSMLTGVEQSSTIASNPSQPVNSTAGAPPATPKLAEVTPAPVESKMMTDQLSAPTQIPHGITTVAPDEAPPASSSGGAAEEGLDSGGASLVRTVLNVGNNGPTVSPVVVKPDLANVTVSSGVAAGMFLHGAKPVYPAIAKSAHVSGTVVLHATISKLGAIENLRVNSGQEMLRQAAMDAVSTWRYRPYLLNGEPVDIDTTINVVFNNPNE